MTAAIRASPITANPRVREARPEDNSGLVDLAAACAMRGRIALRIERGPDFFALTRLEGERCRIGVVEQSGQITGCIAASERAVYLGGEPSVTGYVGDLKVHPDHRDIETADALCRYAHAATRTLPAGRPVLITVLAGNKSMERRLSGPRGLARFESLAVVRNHSVSVLWKRRIPARAGITVQRATWRDLDEMIELWTRIAPGRQFAPVMDAARLAANIQSAPGLQISSYLVARGRDGTMHGFVALWDQSPMKRMYVERYSPRLAVARACFNLVAPLIGAEPMPAPGNPLRLRSAFHVCVPPDAPDVLRALLVSAHNDLRHTGCSFFNVGLDVRDPLSSALDGFIAQPTDIRACVSSPSGSVDAASLQRLPLHYEIALV